MAEALRVELPACRDEPFDLALEQPALRGRQAAQLDVLDPDPAQPLQDWQRLGVLRLVAVVEGQDDRFARPERDAAASSRPRPGPASRHASPPASAPASVPRTAAVRRTAPGTGAPAGGAAITWYISSGTAACPGGPVGPAGGGAAARIGHRLLRAARAPSHDMRRMRARRAWRRPSASPSRRCRRPRRRRSRSRPRGSARRAATARRRRSSRRRCSRLCAALVEVHRALASARARCGGHCRGRIPARNAMRFRLI